MNRRMTPGLSARISATRLSHIGSSDNPHWPRAILWISRGARRLVNETLTCAACDSADALSAPAHARRGNNQSLGSRMEPDNALTLRRVQPINTALAETKPVRGGKWRTTEYYSSEIQDRHLCSRLLLAPASGLQELHDAYASSRLVAGETRRQRRPRQTPPTRAPQTPLATPGGLGMPGWEA